MKRLMIFIVLSITLVFGCKDNFEDSGIQNISLFHQATGILNVGAEHNLGLDYMTIDSTFSLIDTTQSRRLYDSLLTFLIGINANYDSTAIRAYGYQFPDLIAGQNIYTVLKAYFNGILPTLLPEFSQVELNMINQARNYLYNYDFSGMSNSQIYNHIISKADSLLVDFNAVDWDTVSSASYMKGEAIGGFLAVMKSSAEYWKTQAPVNTSHALAIIQIDAGSFLAAWGGAVFIEIWDNGHVDIKNSNHRIGVGVLGAISGSGGSAYARHGSWLRKFIGI